jgi:hypothetical protein
MPILRDPEEGQGIANLKVLLRVFTILLAWLHLRRANIYSAVLSSATGIN